MGFTGYSGNGAGLWTPNISAPGSKGTLAPPYNVPPEVTPSTNLGPEAQALRDQINADVAAGQLPQDSGSFWSDYKYYLFNPSKMDSSLATASTVAWSVAGIAGGGAVGLVIGTAVLGATSATIGCPAATFLAGDIGSTVGSSVGGWIGSWGVASSQSDRVNWGVGFLGGFTGGACFAAGTQVVVGVNPGRHLSHEEHRRH